MTRSVLTVVPGPEGLALRIRGGASEVMLTPAAARQLAALLLVQAEHVDSVPRISGDIDRCANGCERAAELGGYCEACVYG